MKKLIPILILLFPILALGQVESAIGLNGEWLLSEINDFEAMSIVTEKGEDAAATSNGASVKVEQPNLTKVPLKEKLKRSLVVGATKFIFTNDKFILERNESSRMEGKFTLQGQQLNFLFNGQKKENKVLGLTEDKLVIETRNDGHLLVLTFSKTR